MAEGIKTEQQRRQDSHARAILKREIYRTHRPDVSASDLAQIAKATGNRALSAQIDRAFRKSSDD